MFIFWLSGFSLSSVAKVFILVVLYGFGYYLHKLMIWSWAPASKKRRMKHFLCFEKFSAVQRTLILWALHFHNGVPVGADVSNYKSALWRFNVNRLILNCVYSNVLMALTSIFSIRTCILYVTFLSNVRRDILYDSQKDFAVVQYKPSLNRSVSL
jgi:hypothetical protein